MRITPGMTADNAIYNLQQGRAAMDELQEQISSGSIVNRPSDDPLSARQLLELDGQIAAGDQYISNIEKGSLFLDVSSAALSGMSEIMQQVQKIAGTMASGTTDQLARDMAASNLANLKQQLIDYGNTQMGDQYAFSGFKNAQPFDNAGNFTGTSDALKIEVAKGSQVTINITGGNLLRGGGPPAAVGSGLTAGTSPVDVLGGIDALIAAINSNNTTGIADGVKNMKAGSEQINGNLTVVAGSKARLDNMKSLITNNQNTLKSIYGDMQNVDYAKAGVELSRQTTAFSAALSTSAKLSQLSLLDYMK